MNVHGNHNTNILKGINAFDYMVFGRMIYYFLPSQRLFKIRASIIALVFVSLDIISFVIQLVGGNLAGPSAPAEDQLRAIHIYMGGIGLQEFFIVVFLLLAIQFYREMNVVEGSAIMPKKGWKPLLLTLYVSLTLITVCYSSNPNFRRSSLTLVDIGSNRLPLDRVLAWFRCVKSAFDS